MNVDFAPTFLDFAGVDIPSDIQGASLKPILVNEGKTPADWDKWKLNYGIGLRIQLQPRKNFRLDIGKEPGQKWGIYMNMTEAF